jgi:hypothetical protein
MIARRDDLLRMLYKASRLCATVCLQFVKCFRERVRAHSFSGTCMQVCFYIQFLFRLFPNFCVSPLSKFWSKKFLHFSGCDRFFIFFGGVSFWAVQVVTEIRSGECRSSFWAVVDQVCSGCDWNLLLKVFFELLQPLVQVVVTNFYFLFFPWECFLAGCDWIFWLESVFLSCCAPLSSLWQNLFLKSVFSAVVVAKLRHSHKWWWWRQFRVLV